MLSLHLFFRKLTQVLPSLMKMELSRPDKRLWAQRPTSNTRSRTGRDRKFMWTDPKFSFKQVMKLLVTPQDAYLMSCSTALFKLTLISVVTSTWNLHVYILKKENLLNDPKKDFWKRLKNSHSLKISLSFQIKTKDKNYSFKLFYANSCFTVISGKTNKKILCVALFITLLNSN